MTSEDLRAFIEIAAAAVFLLGPIGVIVERYKSKRGLGARAIQFCAVLMLIPAVLILALEKVLEPSTVGTLIGALTGYLLSGLGEYKPNQSRRPDD
ncbi:MULTISPECIES: hypothetical protein [Aurantimonas]|uniref:hypothetical protein n=1 Tax=Aurantimonas TaxID=182269 RepID=UPI003512857F